jgi:dihydrofolate synthase/folylpolyglutamate synthase
MHRGRWLHWRPCAIACPSRRRPCATAWPWWNCWALPGVPGQPVLVLDVAHNPHSVAALTANLDAMGFSRPRMRCSAPWQTRTWLPCWRASAHRGPLVLLRPAHAPGRICGGLAAKWNALQMVAGGRREVHCSTHANPADALQAALVQADPADRIVVFGSFYTVGGCCWTACPDCRPSTWPDTAF